MGRFLNFIIYFIIAFLITTILFVIAVKDIILNFVLRLRGFLYNEFIFMYSRFTSKKIIFIGSSSEGMDIAYKVIAELKNKGFYPLPWFDCFKTSRPPIQELEQISLRLDAAILVATMDDSTVVRNQEWTQMRDNVLYEYGLFSGIIGRSKCGLLVPDNENFKIPSDFLGVSCYESYKSNNVEKVISSIIDSINKTFSKSPSDETINSRGRRLLQFVGWIRNESFRLTLEWDSEHGRELISKRIVAISGFIQDDIKQLNLSNEYGDLEAIVLESTEKFPKILTNGSYHNLEYLNESFLEGVTPNHDVLFGLLYELERKGHIESCFRLIEKNFDSSYQLGEDWFWKNRRFYCKNFYYGDRPLGFDQNKLPCHHEVWAIGVAEAASYFDQMARTHNPLLILDKWSKKFLPKLDKAISNFEQRLHEEIFGKL